MYINTPYSIKLISEPIGLASVMSAPAKARSLSANQTLAVRLIAFKNIGAAAITIIYPIMMKQNWSSIAVKSRNQLPTIIRVDAILKTVLLISFE